MKFFKRIKIYFFLKILESIILGKQVGIKISLLSVKR